MADIEVRERILAEATRLFAHRGFGSTSVREVVEAAGVTKPTLYYYFENKEALFFEVVNEHLGRIQALVEEALATPGPIRKRLHRFVERYVEGALQNIDAVRLLLTLHHEATDQCHPRIDLMSMHLRKIELMHDLFREGIARGELREDLDIRAAVLAFIGSVNLYLMSRVHGSELSADFPDRLLDLFFDGVAKR